jgi:putative ABC transport system substrate-binding protein
VQLFIWPSAVVSRLLALALILEYFEPAELPVPSATSIALVSDPGNPTSETVNNDAKKAETPLGIQIYILEAHTLSEIETAFTRAAELQAGAIVFSVGPVFTSNAQQIAALATRYRTPTSTELRDFARAGGLISYGADLVDAYRLTGVYVGQILHGAKPAELPVQQSTKIEMVINLKTAKALGVTVPLPLLGRADEVIE